MVKKYPESKLSRKPDFMCFAFEKTIASQDIMSKIYHQTKSFVFSYLRMNLIKKYSGWLRIHTLKNSLTVSD